MCVIIFRIFILLFLLFFFFYSYEILKEQLKQAIYDGFTVEEFEQQ